MAQTGDNEKILTRYLLGRLSEEENREIEGKYFADDDFYDRLRAAETDLIDKYARGELSRQDRRLFEEHFISTPARAQRVKFAGALQEYLASRPRAEAPKRAWRGFASIYKSSQFSSPYIGWAVAALLLVFVGLAVRAILPGGSGPNPVRQVARGDYRGQRYFDERISGFNYAPVDRSRGGQDPDEINEDETPPDVGRDSPEYHHLRGQLFFARGKLDRAELEFKAALAVDGQNAQIHNDLGALLLAKGKHVSDKAQRELAFADSLTALKKALELDDSMLEARFNLALWYEQYFMWDKAAEQWEEYLKRDETSEWASEAKNRLRRVKEAQEQQVSRTGEEVLREFLSSYEARDDDRAWEVIRLNRDAGSGADRAIWWRLLSSFYDPAAGGPSDDAGGAVARLEYVGGLEAERAGDLFVRGLADYCRSLPADRRPALARAHNLITAAHAERIKGDYSGALRMYSAAGGAFEKAGNRWQALFAGYWAGYCHLQNANGPESFSSLQKVARACEASGYKRLLAQTLTSLANSWFLLKEYSKALDETNRALAISEEIKDSYAVQKNLAQLTLEYLNVHNHEEALDRIGRCVEEAASHWPGPKQMYDTYEAASQALMAAGFYEAAAEFAGQVLRVARDDIKDPLRTYLSYATLGTIQGKLGDYAAARESIERGLEMIDGRDDEKGRMLRAYSLLQLGHLHRQAGDFGRASDCYDESIRMHDELKVRVFSYESHKGRFVCRLAQKDYRRAAEELRTALSLLEQDRPKILEDRYGSTLFNKDQNAYNFFDVEQETYDLAIGFEHSIRANAAGAYELSEQSRARVLLNMVKAGARERLADQPSYSPSTTPPVSQPLKLAELRRLMPENAQILQYAALDDRLLIYIISKTDFSYTERRVSLDELRRTVDSYMAMISRVPGPMQEELLRASRRLYEILIGDVKPLLDKEKWLIVIPDKMLCRLPFQALVCESGRYLIQDYRISYAPSATIFVVCSNEAVNKGADIEESILAVGAPDFDREANDLPALPESGLEARRVADYYGGVRRPLTGADATEGRVRAEMGRADVIHLASHYVVNGRAPNASQLLLSAPPARGEAGREADGLLEAQEIYELDLSKARLVVLSACRTGVERFYNGEGMIGMARTFLARRVPLVVASLWNAYSDSTAELMVRFHQHRKRGGLPTAEALRRAQLDMLGGQYELYKNPHYWAPFAVIGGLASF